MTGAVATLASASTLVASGGAGGTLENEHEPDHLLRIVRTPTELICHIDKEDERRRGKRGRRRRDTIREKTRRLFSIKRSHFSEKAGHEERSLEDGEELPRIGRQRTDLGVEEQKARAQTFVGGSGQASPVTPAKLAEGRRRRSVWLNWNPPEDQEGRTTPWARNKVKTSKYTLVTFLPKNLAEQFRRAANLYFLVLVVLQVFPMFGAAAPQIAMLPLLAVLTMTAFKDALEDWRRHRLDNEVNNSAVTRLGTPWKNVNLPKVKPNIFLRMLRFGRSVQVPDPRRQISRGVRKLREKEGDYSTDFLYSSTVALTKPEATDATSVAATEAVESLRYSDDYSRSNLTLGMSRTRSEETTAKSMRSGITKEGVQGVLDYSRRAVSAGSAWERTLWKKLEVGDIVLLREDEPIPADVVALSTSDADGICFVETKNLDGETNLKPRRCLRATLGVRAEEDLEHARFVVDSEPPNANLYAYSGVLHYPVKGEIQAVDPALMQEPLAAKEAITINELLLRGTTLRNTAWVIGMVVMTGADTKIMLNQGETPSKRSKIEKETNFNVLANFVILVLLCLVCAIANGIFLGRANTSADFYEPGIEISNSIVLDAVITFASCLILFQNIVPISLVISVELVKSIQALFIHFDIDMYYEPLDHPCVPRSWNISDDLGQIAYIFSDKTGTLTQNVMEFQRCSVGGKPYGEGITESMVGAARREGRDKSALDPLQNKAAIEAAKSTMIDSLKRTFTNRYQREDKLTLISPALAADLAERTDAQRQRLVQFFRSIALCHTALAEFSEDDQGVRIEYKAESPDEAALVSGARDVGFVFLKRTMRTLEIEVMGQMERWEPLRVLEFNSTRKRMSVCVRAPDGRIHLICKGADSVIYQRLRDDHDADAKQHLTKDLEDFANGGLRTLCIAGRILGEEEFKDWAKLYDAACASVDDREEEIEKACELIERDLVLQGATALEDKLQVGVPECIEALHQAGIKLWVLTGDKLQTAIEIGFAANVLQPAYETMLISSETAEGCRTQVEQGLEKLKAAREKGDYSQQFAVVIDGETLRHALDPALKQEFMQLTVACATVICCRVSPAQKAQTVLLIKEGQDAMTLAIGDGANDVAMIQAAHVGVGIAGLEGAQAAMSSDYAIGQFRYLQKLLLVHGHWSYFRIASMHSNFFFKSVVWTWASFLVQPWCNFDALYLFDVTLILAFNLIFSSLPVLILGAFDQDVPAQALLRYPQLYKRGIQGLEYTKTIFWTYMLDGVYQGSVCYFVPYFQYAYISTNTARGYDYGLGEFGSTVAVASVLSANLFVGFNTLCWNWMVFCALIASCLSVFIWLMIMSSVNGTLLSNLIQELFSTPSFYLLLLVTQVIAIGPRYVWRYMRDTLNPSDAAIVRERTLLLQEDVALSQRPAESAVDGLLQLPKRSPERSISARVRDVELASLASGDDHYESAPTSPMGTLTSRRHF